MPHHTEVPARPQRLNPPVLFPLEQATEKTEMDKSPPVPDAAFRHRLTATGLKQDVYKRQQLSSALLWHSE